MAAKNEDPYAVRKYGVPAEVVEAALNDIGALEKLVNDVLELGPMTVSWSAVDRSAPQFDVLRKPRPDGFLSVEHAVNTFASRLSGMRAALTTNTDALLTPTERAARDRIVMEFLDRIRSTCIESIRQ